MIKIKLFKEIPILYIVKRFRMVYFTGSINYGMRVNLPTQ